MKQKIIRNARIVTVSEEFTGCMVLEGGLIRSVERGDTSVTGAEDWAGDWLLPGLVELHTDNLEKHLVPRPGCCGTLTLPPSCTTRCALRRASSPCSIQW